MMFFDPNNFAQQISENLRSSAENKVSQSGRLGKVQQQEGSKKTKSAAGKKTKVEKRALKELNGLANFSEKWRAFKSTFTGRISGVTYEDRKMAKVLEGIQDIGEAAAKLSGVSEEKVGKILSAIAPDKAKAILSAISPDKATAILSVMDPEAAAKILNEVTEGQETNYMRRMAPIVAVAEILDGVPAEKAKAILSAMDPGKAVKILNRMDKEKAGKILNAMEPAASAKILNEVPRDQESDVARILNKVPEEKAIKILSTMTEINLQKTSIIFLSMDAEKARNILNSESTIPRLAAKLLFANSGSLNPMKERMLSGNAVNADKMSKIIDARIEIAQEKKYNEIAIAMSAFTGLTVSDIKVAFRKLTEKNIDMKKIFNENVNFFSEEKKVIILNEIGSDEAGAKVVAGILSSLDPNIKIKYLEQMALKYSTKYGSNTIQILKHMPIDDKVIFLRKLSLKDPGSLEKCLSAMKESYQDFNEVLDKFDSEIKDPKLLNQTAKPATEQKQVTPTISNDILEKAMDVNTTFEEWQTIIDSLIEKKESLSEQELLSLFKKTDMQLYNVISKKIRKMITTGDAKEFDECVAFVEKIKKLFEKCKSAEKFIEMLDKFNNFARKNKDFIVGNGGIKLEESIFEDIDARYRELFENNEILSNAISSGILDKPVTEITSEEVEILKKIASMQGDGESNTKALSSTQEKLQQALVDMNIDESRREEILSEFSEAHSLGGHFYTKTAQHSIPAGDKVEQFENHQKIQDLIQRFKEQNASDVDAQMAQMQPSVEPPKIDAVSPTETHAAPKETKIDDVTIESFSIKNFSPNTLPILRMWKSRLRNEVEIQDAARNADKEIDAFIEELFYKQYPNQKPNEV